MEKFFRPYDKEYMKMAMLKHEEMFRAQVYELHRLYHIQKILMKYCQEEKALSKHNQDRWNSKNTINLNQIDKPQQHVDLEQPAEKCIEESEGDEALEIEDESEIELTLGPSCSYRRRKTDTFFTLDSAQSFSSISSTGSKHLQRTNLLGKPKKEDTVIKESSGQNWGLFEVSEAKSGFFSRERNSSNGEGQLKQKQPPWLLLEAFSLNMT